MRKESLYLFGAGLLLLAGSASAKKKTGGRVTTNKEKLRSERRQRFLCGLSAAQLPDVRWQAFFDQTVYRETGRTYNPRAHNDTSAEVAYSQKSVSRNRAMLEKLAFPPEDWAFGSKGLFQFLGPVIAIEGSRWRFPIERLNPDMAFDPGVAIAGAVDFANDLTSRSSFAGSFASLGVGWGWPADMNDKTKIQNAAIKIEKRAQALGYDLEPGWSQEPLPFTPGERDQGELWTLAEAARFAYESCEIKP